MRMVIETDLLASAGFASNLAWITGDEELIERFGRPFSKCRDGSAIGLSREYETEKLFGDARATLIMDGRNEVVARMGGWLLTKNYPRS